MATIKQDRKDLEMLLNGVAPVSSPMQVQQPQIQSGQPVQQSVTASVVDNTEGTPLPTEKLFEFDHDATRKVLRKKARKTILGIARHILTEEQIIEDYVQDKIEQDIDAMTDLYMQVESNSIMQRSILESVSRGNTMPRMYEVYTQFTDKIQAINKQIQTTEQQMRRTYIDLKLEIKDKESEMRYINEHQQTLPAPEESKDDSLIITSSKQLLESAKKRHREALEKKALEEAKETEFSEE